jgi:oxygen-dependent protoporphyrinogen oxidase
LSRLVDRLADELGARGVDVRLQTRVDRLERHRVSDAKGAAPGLDATRWTLRSSHGTLEADAVIIATPATSAAAIVEPVDHAVAAMLDAIDYAEVTLVTLQMPIEGVGRSLDGTGFLVPAGAGALITACTWLTSKWPELKRPGDVLLRASMGRFGDDRPAAMSDDDIVSAVVGELGPMLGLRTPPTEALVTRWTEAFPQYAVGHLERVGAIDDALARLPGLAVAGAAYGGVGIPACIASGRRAAQVVLAGARRARQSTP